jgi:F0F1-type ATP synthase assembly protein I
VARPRLSDVWSQVAFYTSLGFVIPASVVVGYGLGWLLDRRLHSQPVCALIGGFAGAVLGITEVIQTVLRKQKSDEDRPNQSGSR